MTITSLTSRELNQHTSKAKRAADKEVELITDRGQTTHVLLSIKEYQRLTEGQQKIADLLAMPAIEDIEFEISAMRELARSENFSSCLFSIKIWPQN